MISVERRNATAHSSLERGQGRLHRHMRYDTWMSTRNGQTSTALLLQGGFVGRPISHGCDDVDFSSKAKEGFQDLQHGSSYLR